MTDTRNLRVSDEQERDAMKAIEGKTIAGVWRGRDGWSDATIFVQFTDGTRLHVLDASTLYFNKGGAALP